METPTTAIRDFLTAVDRGYLGAMPEGFNDSAFVKALREQASAPDMVAAEREACAKIADELYMLYLPVDETGDRTDQAIADVLYKAAAAMRERTFAD
jgi:hypothetical protein